MLEAKDNNISIFNESMVSIYLYLMVCLTDFNEANPFKVIIGWALVATVMTSTTVNVLKFLITVSSLIKEKYRIKRLKLERDERINKLKINQDGLASKL